MKHLLVCFLALLAVPAAATSTSKTVTITITAPAGVCQASPPAPAVAAGLTTQALCSDWTVAMPANWMGGCATAGNGAPVNSGDQSGHNWWLNPWFSNTYQPCIATQVTDPALGGTVLDLSWVTDSNAYNVGTELQSTAWFSTGTPNSGISFPNSAYYEMTFRLAPISKGTWGGIFTWPVLAQTDSSKEGIENDVIEMDVGQLQVMDAAIHNWPLSGPPGQFIWQGYGANNGGIGIGVPLSFDPTVYHTFGLITTSDGVSAYQTCTFTDGVTNSCASQPIPGGWPVGAEATLRYMLMMINACDFWNGTCNPNGTLQHMYVKDVKVWSCPSWATTQCNRPPAPVTINATDFCAANGGGDGSAGNPWTSACIIAAVNAAQTGNTVFLASGNWRTATNDPTGIDITKAINLVGAGSGNTFSAQGNPNNPSAVSLAATTTNGITRVYSTGSSACSGVGGSNLQGGSCTGGWLAFRNCPGNVSIKHIFFDSFLATSGGDRVALPVIDNCTTTTTVIDDIRHLSYSYAGTDFTTCGTAGHPACPSPEPNAALQSAFNVTVQNSIFNASEDQTSTQFYSNTAGLITAVNNNVTIKNTVFWESNFNPIAMSNLVFTGNMEYQTTINGRTIGFNGGFGPSGCSIAIPSVDLGCGFTGGDHNGDMHFTITNNYFNGTGQLFGIGGGVNDCDSSSCTAGGLQDLNVSGNTVLGTATAVTSCVLHYFDPTGPYAFNVANTHDARYTGCAPLQTQGAAGMAINNNISGGCTDLQTNPNLFTIKNNSIVGTTDAVIDVASNWGNWCFTDNSGGHTIVVNQVDNVRATQNYLQSPDNAVNTDGGTHNATISSNFCSGPVTNFPGCSTSGFATTPTAAFTLGTLSGSTLPFASTNFTAQYGAVQWIASTSATTPASGDGRWSPVPPVSLSPVAHGNTVFMWTMDSANHISAAASAVVP